MFAPFIIGLMAIITFVTALDNEKNDNSYKLCWASFVVQCLLLQFSIMLEILKVVNK